MIIKIRKTLAVFLIASVLIISSFALIIRADGEEKVLFNENKVNRSTNEFAWPSRQHDARNTGRSLYDTTHVDGTEKWNITFDKEYLYSPIIGENGTIYVGSENGDLYAVNPDGSLKWTFDTRGMINATPVIGGDGIIYVTSTPNKLFAINPNGTEKWSMELGKYQEILTVDNEGTIYVRQYVDVDNRTNRANFTAINPDGTIEWNYSTYDITDDAPAIGDDGTIYMVTATLNDVYLRAFNPDGVEKWNASIHIGDSFGIVIGNDGDIYVTGYFALGAGESKLLAFNRNGKRKWNMTLQYGAVSPAIGNDGALIVGCSSIDPLLYPRGIYAIKPNGTVEWYNEIGGNGNEIYHPPILDAKDRIYISSRNKSLFALNSNGTINWKFSTDDLVPTTPAIGCDGTIYVTGDTYHGSEKSKLYAIGGTPSKPKNVQISSENERIELSWSPPSDDGGSNITGYYVYRGTSSNNLTFLGELDADITSYSDNGLTNGQTYYYRISAGTDVGEGDRSEIVSATPEDNIDPIANAGDDRTVKVDEDITFDASGSSDNVGITSYEWDFDDGTTAAGKTVEHKFDEKGTYEVTLTVTDEAGNTNTDTVTVTVEKEDNGNNDRIPGFSIIVLILGILSAVLYRYKRKRE